MTPALTPASTASVKRRRSSFCRLAETSALRWRIELAGHAVEGAAEQSDFVVVALDFDLRLEIAFRHALGRADQAGDRPHQTVGGPQARARSRPAG